MIAFIAIAVFFTLSWTSGIWLYGRTRGLYAKVENTWGATFFLVFIVMFAVQIFMVKTVSGVTRPANSAPPVTLPEFGGLTLGQCIFIGILTLLTLLVFSRQLLMIFSYIKKHDQRYAVAAIGSLLLIAFPVLTVIKVVDNPAWVGNILVFMILLIALDFASQLKKSAFILIFGAIMLLDIYLVWNTGMSHGTAGVATGRPADPGWYVRMFQSKMMQHMPFPVGFRWDGHLLGGGDVFFTAIMVMYACRVWSKKAAITVGILATLPLFLLPFAYVVLKAPPMAWPYTIFIAPWALIIAIFAPMKIEAPILHIPEKWKDDDGGPEVIGRPPKTP